MCGVHRSLRADTIDVPDLSSIPRKNHFGSTTSPYPMDMSPISLRAPVAPRPVLYKQSSTIEDAGKDSNSTITLNLSTTTSSASLSSSSSAVVLPALNRSSSLASTSSHPVNTYPFLNQLFRSTSSSSSSSSSSLATVPSRSTSPETFLNPSLSSSASSSCYSHSSRHLASGLELDGWNNSKRSRSHNKMEFLAKVIGVVGESESDGDEEEDEEELQGEMRPPTLM